MRSLSQERTVHFEGRPVAVQSHPLGVDSALLEEAENSLNAETRGRAKVRITRDHSRGSTGWTTSRAITND